jgi:hypothetical protein
MKRFFSMVCLASTALGLQPIPPRLFDVPGHGRLRTVIPLEWRAASKPLAEPSSVSVRITPFTGDAFEIRITAVWLNAAARNRMTPEAIRANVKRSAEALLIRSDNKSVIIEDLQGEQAAGHYFTLADSDPAPGEYQYITQGSFLAGELMTAFTIFHREPGTREVGQALKMLSGATHVP